MKEGAFIVGIAAIVGGVWWMSGTGAGLLTMGILFVVCAVLAQMGTDTASK